MERYAETVSLSWYLLARHRTNRWTGATGSDFRVIIGPAKLLGSAVARSTPPFGVYLFGMNAWPHLNLELTFLSPSEGGRQTPPPQIGHAPGRYRPHIVIGDPNQRKAIAVGNQGQETYLAVIFFSGPDEVRVGEPIEAEAELMYYPLPEHDAVVPGATFTLRESSRIVGYGRVKKFCFPLTTPNQSLDRSHG